MLSLVFAHLLSVYLSVCLPASSHHQPLCLSACLYVYFSAVTLSIHQSCCGLFEVTKLSILVISGCQHKRLRATSLTSQKGPCIQTKKPLLCNALMLSLLMLLLTMIENRQKTAGGNRYGERKDDSLSGAGS